MRAEHEFANPRHFGPVTALCLDRKHLWLVSGTANGVLSVWDLRFGLLLRSWSIGPRRIHQIAVHPVKGKGRWIVVAADPDDGLSSAGSSDFSKPRRSSSAATAPLPGTTVAEVWDIDRGHKVDEFRIVSPQQQSAQSTALANRTNVFASSAPATSSVSMQDASLDPAAAIEALLAASTAPQPAATAKSSEAGRQAVPPIQPTVRAFLLGTDYSMQTTTRPAASHLVTLQDQQDGYGREAAAKGAAGKDKDGGFLITGGEDRKLRFWDLGRVSRSAVVSGLGIDEEVPTFRCVCFARVVFWISLTLLVPQHAYVDRPPFTASRPHSKHDPPRVDRSSSHPLATFLLLSALPSRRAPLLARPPLHPDRQLAATASPRTSGGDHGCQRAGLAVQVRCERRQGGCREGV